MLQNYNQKKKVCILNNDLGGSSPLVIMELDVSSVSRFVLCLWCAAKQYQNPS